MKCERVEQCEQCTKWYAPKYRGKRRFCSDSCVRKSRSKTRIENLWCQCLCCSNIFLKNEKSDVGKYCSRVCGAAARRIEPTSCDVFYVVCGSGCGEVRTQQDKRSYSCRTCKLYRERIRAIQNSVANDNVDRSPRPCKECSVVFAPTSYGDKRKEFCGLECSTRYGRRPTRAARKAKIRGATTVSFNPITVLERDGWRCYLCGVDTPKVLRGTYEPNAPELDHIIALANGGEHSPDNTACACRQCNGFKSANDNYIPTRVAA